MQKRLFGLIGFPLNNQFSVTYFTQKFEQKQLPYTYQNFPLTDIGELAELLQKHKNLSGLNITKPYKEKIIPFLDELASSAKLCGAVNCLEIMPNGKKIGHNTDLLGFRSSFENFIGSNRQKKALVFGNGGAAKAVLIALEQLSIDYMQVIRKTPEFDKQIHYSELNEEDIFSHELLINTTPVGMFPDTEAKLPIPTQTIGSNHYCYDLIYLPEKTMFLQEAEKQGAHIKNGLEMLHLQADEAFNIWMKNES